MDADEKWKVLGDFVETVEGEFGGEHLQSGDEMRRTPRVSTGSILVDACLGGGWPFGKFSSEWGEEGTGKTTLALHTAKWIQRHCAMCQTLIKPNILLPPGSYERASHHRWEPVDDVGDELVEEWLADRMKCRECGAPHHDEDRPPPPAGDVHDEVPEGVDRGAPACRDCGAVAVEGIGAGGEWDHPYGDFECACGENVPSMILWGDTEKDLEKGYAESIGVDMSRLHRHVPTTGEELIDVGLRGISEGAFEGWIIDSLNNFQLSKDLEASFAEANFGTDSAITLNNFFRQLPSFLFDIQARTGSMPVVLGINQVRKDVGSFHGGDTQYGGKGQNFQAAVRVKMTSKTKSEGEVEQISVKSQDRNEYIGVEKEALFKGFCDKNGTAPTEGRQFSLRIATANEGSRYPGKIEDLTLVWNYARETGIREKRGGEWHFDGWPLSYETDGKCKRAMDRHWWFKHHLHRESIRRIMEDWGRVKRNIES